MVIKVAELTDGTTVLLHEDGTVRIWELDYDTLTSSRAEWRRMLGMEEADSMDGNGTCPPRPSEHTSSCCPSSSTHTKPTLLAGLKYSHVLSGCR
eukprot:COSAG06_NODE_978_length_11240_cov_3.328606_2_plen_95_part_00